MRLTARSGRARYRRRGGRWRVGEEASLEARAKDLFPELAAIRGAVWITPDGTILDTGREHLLIGHALTDSERAEAAQYGEFQGRYAEVAMHHGLVRAATNGEDLYAHFSRRLTGAQRERLLDAAEAARSFTVDARGVRRFAERIEAPTRAAAGRLLRNAEATLAS